MSIYSQYLRERLGFETLEFGSVGFMTFKVTDDECYIRDMYIAPEFRRKKCCWEMANQMTEIALKRGCKYLSGTLSKGAAGNHESLCAMIAYGFQLFGWTENMIVLKKDL